VEKTKSESIQKPKATTTFTDLAAFRWGYVIILEANLTSTLSGVTDPIFVLQRIGANVEDALLA